MTNLRTATHRNNAKIGRGEARQYRNIERLGLALWAGLKASTSRLNASTSRLKTSTSRLKTSTSRLTGAFYILLRALNTLHFCHGFPIESCPPR